MNFWKCFRYLVFIGVVAFPVGRILPKKWFFADMFPYRSYRFEDEGRYYDKFKIRYWQSKVPDMSKILPQCIPAKNLSGNFRERLPRILQETCIAELIHSLLCFAGLYCMKLWPGVGGVIISLINIFILNLPFIIIQRYNRPRLSKLYEKVKERNPACSASTTIMEVINDTRKEVPATNH